MQRTSLRIWPFLFHMLQFGNHISLILKLGGKEGMYQTYLEFWVVLPGPRNLHKDIREAKSPKRLTSPKLCPETNYQGQATEGKLWLLRAVRTFPLLHATARKPNFHHPIHSLGTFGLLTQFRGNDQLPLLALTHPRRTKEKSITLTPFALKTREATTWLEGTTLHSPPASAKISRGL